MICAGVDGGDSMELSAAAMRPTMRDLNFVDWLVSLEELLRFVFNVLTRSLTVTKDLRFDGPG